MVFKLFIVHTHYTYAKHKNLKKKLHCRAVGHYNALLRCLKNQKKKLSLNKQLYSRITFELLQTKEHF